MADAETPHSWFRAMERFEREIEAEERNKGSQLVGMVRDGHGRGTAIVGAFNSQGYMVGAKVIEQTADKVATMRFRLTPELVESLRLFLA